MSDPYFEHVALLLHADAGFTDSSQWGHSVTPSGNVQISAAQARFGGGSAYFDGSGDRLTIPGHAAFDFSSGPTTFEGWFYPLNLPSGGNWCRLWMFGGNGSAASFIPIQFAADGMINAGVPAGGTTGLSTPTGTLVTGVWQHIAVVLDGANSKIFKDGQVVASGAITPPTAGSPPCYLGYDTVGTVDHNYYGYIDDLRITRGIARYTANFTPPTEAFPDVGPPSTVMARATRLGVAVLSPALTPRTAAPTTGHLVLRGWAPAEARAVRLGVAVLSPSAATLAVAPSAGHLAWAGHAPAVTVLTPLSQTLQRPCIPAGRLFFDPGTGERYLGETPGAELSVEIKAVEVYGSDAPVSELLDEVPFGVSRELAFKCLNPADEVIAWFFGADAGLLTQAAATVTDEPLAGVEPGRWYQLGRTAGNPTGVRLLTDVTVTDDASPTPAVFAEDEDYTVAPALGRLYVVPGGAITAGVNLRVTYTQAAATRTRHQGATWLLPRLSGALRFIAHHTSGPNRDIYAPRVLLRADGAAPIKRAAVDGKVLELGFKARFQRLDDAPALYIDGRAVA